MLLLSSGKRATTAGQTVMDSTYAPPDIAQQVPIEAPGYSVSMSPLGNSGSGAGTLQHSSYHQAPTVAQQHQQHQQQPQSLHTHRHPQARASVHHHHHSHQYRDQGHQQPAHTHSRQAREQLGGHPGHSHQHPPQQQQQRDGPQSPLLHPSQQSQLQSLPHPLPLDHYPSQSQHLSPNSFHHRQAPLHAAQPNLQAQLPSDFTLRPEEEPFHAPVSSPLVSGPEPQPGNLNLLLPLAKVDEVTGRKYQLDVVQQPRRARMCGFGDKDRRPITPPPCVRLIITDIGTGKEIDCNNIDYSMFVLNVDLWNEEGTREVNLVRSSTNSPSIASMTPYSATSHSTTSHSTTPYSYVTPNGGDAALVCYGQAIPSSRRDTQYDTAPTAGFMQVYQTQSSYGHSAATYPSNGTYGPPQQFFPQHQVFRPDLGIPPCTMSLSRNGSLNPGGHAHDQGTIARMAIIGGQPQGMFTRNLIGSLAASAFRLSDTSDQIGIWFVLQDLSVRTEGPFRLKFSFVNVGPQNPSSRDGNALRVNTGRAPILASCFSDVFNVFSAKKFPGVCESTSLSKIFATQGIKIPIRKDASMKGGDGEDDYGD